MERAGEYFTYYRQAKRPIQDINRQHEWFGFVLTDKLREHYVGKRLHEELTTHRAYRHEPYNADVRDKVHIVLSLYSDRSVELMRDAGSMDCAVLYLYDDSLKMTVLVQPVRGLLHPKPIWIANQEQEVECDINYHPEQAIIELVEILLYGTETLLPDVPEAVLTASYHYFEELIARIARDYSTIHEVSQDNFEELIIELLIRDGYAVTPTQKTGDGGIDMFAEKLFDRLPVVFAIEAKHPKVIGKPISVGIARSFATSVRHSSANRGILVTSSRFTPRALQVTDKELILAQDKSKLHEWIQDIYRRSQC